MSEVSDIFDFRKEDGGLDIDAIFGKNEDVTDPAPVVEELPVLAVDGKQPEEADVETTSQQPLETDAVSVGSSQPFFVGSNEPISVGKLGASL